MTAIPFHIVAKASPEDFMPRVGFRSSNLCEFCAQTDGHYYACPYAVEQRRIERERLYTHKLLIELDTEAI